MLKHRLKGVNIAHIHWLYFLKIPIPGKLGYFLSYSNSRLILAFLKVLNFHVVWTVHNVLPHDKLTSNDLNIRQLLSKEADVKIVHNKETLKEMRRLGISSGNHVIIPHGNFSGTYVNVLSKAESRKKLRIPHAAKVVLFFGRIEAYKNIVTLLRAFTEITATNPDMYLLVAGIGIFKKYSQCICAMLTPFNLCLSTHQ